MRLGPLSSNLLADDLARQLKALPELLRFYLSPVATEIDELTHYVHLRTIVVVVVIPWNSYGVKGDIVETIEQVIDRPIRVSDRYTLWWNQNPSFNFCPCYPTRKGGEAHRIELTYELRQDRDTVISQDLRVAATPIDNCVMQGDFDRYQQWLDMIDTKALDREIDRRTKIWHEQIRKSDRRRQGPSTWECLKLVLTFSL